MEFLKSQVTKLKKGDLIEVEIEEEMANFDAARFKLKYNYTMILI